MSRLLTQQTSRVQTPGGVPRFPRDKRVSMLARVPWFRGFRWFRGLLLRPVTEEEVIGCQRNWAQAIKSISKTYLEKGDYISAAADAAAPAAPVAPWVRAPRSPAVLLVAAAAARSPSTCSTHSGRTALSALSKCREPHRARASAHAGSLGPCGAEKRSQPQATRS